MTNKNHTTNHLNISQPAKNSLIASADIAIIGGGVVGCAVARRMALEGASIVLIEKASDILNGASKGNSAILHTGFDAPVGSLEQKCVSKGYEEYLKIHDNFNLPLVKIGALIAAWSEEEEGRFDQILQKGQENGVNNLRLLSQKEARSLEPNLSEDIRSAIAVPGEFIIDPWSSPLAYLQQALNNGGQVLFNAKVIGGQFDGSHWLLDTKLGQVKAHYVVNCAGLYGDCLNRDVLGESEFTIKPRKGQFVVFDKAANELLKSIILPVPTEFTKGVVLFPTIFGNLVAGPTAEEQESRNDASVDKATLVSLKEQAIQRLPALSNIPVTATYAGIRPASEEKHYRVSHDTNQNWITLGGIRSTGLTGALGLAQHVNDLLSKQGSTFKAIEKPISSQVPNLAEHLPRDYEAPGYGEIVCHCEMVTQREILTVQDGLLPARSLEGLKRRTRVTMGRCQGFYCSARLAELTKGQFSNSIAIGDANE